MILDAFYVEGDCRSVTHEEICVEVPSLSLTAREVLELEPETNRK